MTLMAMAMTRMTTMMATIDNNKINNSNNSNCISKDAQITRRNIEC